MHECITCIHPLPLFQDSVVDVNGWYTGVVTINIDRATVVIPGGGKLLAPHSLAMPVGTFKKMFDAGKASFMVTSGTIQNGFNEEVVLPDNPNVETSHEHDLPWIEPFGIHAISRGDHTIKKDELWAMAFDSPASGLYDSVLLFQGDQNNDGNTRNIEVAVFEIVNKTTGKEMRMLSGSSKAQWVGSHENDGDWHQFSLPGLNALLVKNTRYYFVIRNKGPGAWDVATHQFNPWHATTRNLGDYGRRMVYQTDDHQLEFEEYLPETGRIISLADGLGNATQGQTPYFRLYEKTTTHPVAHVDGVVYSPPAPQPAGQTNASPDYKRLYANYVGNDFTTGQYE
jgi:hypothetical protein